MTEDLHDNKKNMLEDAVEQFVDAQLQGREPVIDDFVKKYPDFEDQVRKRIQKLRKIDTLFASLVKTNDIDFEDITDEQDLVGKKVGSFEIAEIIGRGGMGVVYLARDTKLKRSVAVKSIPAALAGDSTARTRFRREAELLASLNHPNIAVIHDIVEQEDSVYLVLEYIEGETLADRIAREPLNLEEALSISRQVAEAVSVAHKKGIVHRDLKPGNIKITPEGRVKVLDFGLAKAPTTQGNKGEITKTQPGRVFGTPAYMSPEQARGKETDHHTDIWSFGCLMYQMLTGRLPFEGETATDTIVNIIERQPDWEALPQDTPANISKLLQCCLEKDPDRRIEDITDAAIEITETLSTPARLLPVRLQRMTITVGVTVIIVLSAVTVWFTLTKETPISSKQIRLVVLPFENLGPAEDEYFVDGITDEITVRLAGISELRIISRQSAMLYKNKEIGVQQIARELNVDYILDGTIQRDGPLDPNGRVKIRPQLIKTSDDTHVWARIYDDSISEVFRVQSDIAEQVARRLNITLLESERQALASIPTENMEAWNFYLQGNEYYDRDFHENYLRIAIQMWEKAVTLDPQFTLAYAMLSHAFNLLYWNHGGRPADLERAKKTVQTAMGLDPDLPEVHLALGHYYYHGQRNYESALKEFVIVLKSQPDNSEALSFVGWIYKRQGKYEQALANLKRAYEFSPRLHFYPLHIAMIYKLLNRYEEAESFYDKAISLAPDRPRAYNGKMSLYLCQGNTNKARAVLKEVVPYPNAAKDPEIADTLVYIDVCEGNYQAALDRLSSISSEALVNWPNFYPNVLRRAQIYGYMKKEDLAEEHYAEARSILERKIREDPNNSVYQSALGIAYAGLGLKEKAIRIGQEAVEKLPVSKDAVNGPWRVRNLACIYTMVNEHDLAIHQLEILLSKPSLVPVPLLRLDPAWDPLRNHPRFKKLVELKR